MSDRRASQPFLLNDRAAAWWIEEGSVDVFATRLEDGRPTGARTHLFRAGGGEALIGMDGESPEIALLAVATTATRLLRVDRSTVPPAVIDAWARRLAAVTADAERRARTEGERIRQRATFDRRTLSAALTRFASILSPRTHGSNAGAAQPPLLAACRLIGDRLGVTIADADLVGRTPAERVAGIARSSALRMRRVSLRDDWWRHDNGPLLAFSTEGDRPVALLPRAAGAYDLVDPESGTSQRVNAETAATLGPGAFMFYRPFPDRALTAKEILAFGTRNSRADLRSILLLGLGLGVIGMLVPLAAGVIFGTIIPGAERMHLLQIVAALGIGALVAAAFKVAQGIAVVRVEGALDTSVQAALWDRILDLPVSFFRRHSAGDLASRAYGLTAIRETLSAMAVSTILTAVFSFCNVALLFYLDSRLAFVATALIAAALLVTAAALAAQLRNQRSIFAIQGRLSGAVLQFVTGVSKLRVAAAESRAFAAWGEKFAEQKRLAFRSRTIGNAVTVFNSVFPILSLAALFLWIGNRELETLPTGTFVAFYVAFATLAIAVMQMNQALVASLDVVPLFERLRPILDAQPEVDASKADPGELRGDLELSHIVFRYRSGGAAVMNDLSLRVAAGELVAIVGPSGSGKSTLFRMILGFETPESGTVFVDRHDIAGLDLRAVRRQIGVVLQDGRLMQGDVFTNIVGTNLLSHDDAWAAARLAGFEDDILAMPMGMFTWIGEGGGTLSGGQKQRLLIARALVTRPRILLFDEATSALDNRTQAIVSRSLEGLRATRIVIAHRLSTVMNADRIYVVEHGRIVQSGTYAELIAQPGLFAQLAERQLA